MNITDNLIRIKEGKDNIIQSLKNKGVSISDNTLINEIPTIIDNAEIGGGGDTPSQPEIPELVQKYEGASVFRINVPEDNYEFAINLCNNASTATYDVDWGDGVLQSGLTTDEQHHTYSKSGIYDVNIYNLSKNITLGGSLTKNINGVAGNSFIFSYLFNNTNNDYWVQGYVNIRDLIIIGVLIGDKITIIGSNAFLNCSSLQNVTIENSVTSIESGAFQGCSNLTSVIIPEGVTKINNYTFSNCRSLTSINIPNSVTSISSSVFQECGSLTSINIPNSVTSIGSNAFQNCSNLTSVIIPEGVTFIGDYIFQGCSNLTSIIIPNSVTSIGSNAFQGCSNLTSVIIPEGVTKINNYTFSNCRSLTSINIPNSVTSISSSVFQECGSLTSINIPNSVTSIGSSVFSNSYFLQSITCESLTAPTITSSSFPTSSFKYTKRYLYVPKDSVGYNDGNWKTYLIDKGWELRYIEDKPEKTPTTLKLKTKNNFLHKWVNLSGAKLIHYDLIDNEYIYHFDDKITELSSYYFDSNVLTSIEIPEGVEVLGDNLFNSAMSLKSLNIPSTVRTIGNNCFYRVPIQEIIIPEGVEILPKSMCESCSLKNIVIPSTVTTINSRCFMYNSFLSIITCKAMIAPTIQSDTFSSVGYNVPSGTPKILRIPQGSSGYEDTTSQWYKQLILKGFTLEYIVPNTLTYTSYSGDTVTPYAKSFEGKNEIVSNVYENGIGTLTFKEGLTEIYDSMYNKDIVSEITTIEIPNGVTRIGNYSFRSQYLTTLNVPDSVTYIGDSAFNGCTNLTEITLGSNVETIGQWAFSSCTKVATITSMAMVAPTLNQSFLNVGGDVSGDKILRIPESAEGYDSWLSQLGDFTIEYI